MGSALSVRLRQRVDTRRLGDLALLGLGHLVVWRSREVMVMKHHPLPAMFTKYCEYSEEIFADGVLFYKNLFFWYNMFGE